MFVYMLRCADGSFYTGYTDNLEVRYWQHLTGTGSTYARYRRPVRLIQAWQLRDADRRQAMQLERRIKSLSRPEKEALVQFPGLLGKLAGVEAAVCDVDEVHRRVMEQGWKNWRARAGKAGASLLRDSTAS